MCDCRECNATEEEEEIEMSKVYEAPCKDCSRRKGCARTECARLADLEAVAESAAEFCAGSSCADSGDSPVCYLCRLRQALARYDRQKNPGSPRL